MNLSELRTGMVHRDDRWLIADEVFEKFLHRPLGYHLKRKLERELVRSARPADIQLAKERAYDRETERLRRDIRALAQTERTPA